LLALEGRFAEHLLGCWNAERPHCFGVTESDPRRKEGSIGAEIGREPPCRTVADRMQTDFPQRQRAIVETVVPISSPSSSRSRNRPRTRAGPPVDRDGGAVEACGLCDLDICRTSPRKRARQTQGSRARRHARGNDRVCASKRETCICEIRSFLGDLGLVRSRRTAGTGSALAARAVARARATLAHPSHQLERMVSAPARPRTHGRRPRKSGHRAIGRVRLRCFHRLQHVVLTHAGAFRDLGHRGGRRSSLRELRHDLADRSRALAAARNADRPRGPPVSFDSPTIVSPSRRSRTAPRAPVRSGRSTSNSALEATAPDPAACSPRPEKRPREVSASGLLRIQHPRGGLIGAGERTARRRSPPGAGSPDDLAVSALELPSTACVRIRMAGPAEEPFERSTASDNPDSTCSRERGGRVRRAAMGRLRRRRHHDLDSRPPATIETASIEAPGTDFSSCAHASSTERRRSSIESTLRFMCAAALATTSGSTCTNSALAGIWAERLVGVRTNVAPESPRGPSSCTCSAGVASAAAHMNLSVDSIDDLVSRSMRRAAQLLKSVPGASMLAVFDRAGRVWTSRSWCPPEANDRPMAVPRHDRSLAWQVLSGLSDAVTFERSPSARHSGSAHTRCSRS